MIITFVHGLLTLVGGLALRAAIGLSALALLVLPIAIVVLVYALAVRLVARLRGVRQIGHVSWRDGCFYTPGHFWLRPSTDGVRVGLDDVAQRLLPEITGLSLVPAGSVVDRGAELGRIRCAGVTVPLRAPVSGRVAAVNAEAIGAPALLHRDPYRRGWLVDVEPADRSYVKLPHDAAARQWLADEDRRLTGFFEHALGVAAADGGELVLPPHQALTADQWQAILTEFLRPA
jgi:glycine cleavage system H protein